jgi:hypothetical protein
MFGPAVPIVGVRLGLACSRHSVPDGSRGTSQPSTARPDLLATRFEVRTSCGDSSDGQKPAPASHAGSENVSSMRVHVLGGAEALWGDTCPDVSIPVDDGTVDDFQGTRHATGDRQRFGNDGPNNQGLPGHYKDQCVTTNNHPHQDFRWAEMAGTPNGHRLHSYPWAKGPATIFDGHYSFQYVEHEGCSPLHETALARPRIPSRVGDPSRALIGHDRADRRHERTLPRSWFARAGWTRLAPCEVGAEGSPRDLPG